MYEVELVIKTGKSIPDINAASYISEIGVGIDYREGKGTWELAKGFDVAAPVSSFKSVKSFPDLDNINFSLMINGDEKQKATLIL